jgi:zinc/manganese transport system substrate-binding protein
MAKKGVIFFTLSVIIALLLSACGGAEANNPSSTAPTGSTISIVAAENFYGDIARQIGGSHVTVTSILSDPEVDPHEYESNVQNGIAVTKAQIVLKNGGGYDEWMDKLLSASPNDKRIVISAFDTATTKLTNNEHVWYSINNAQAVALAIATALKKVDAGHSSDYEGGLKSFEQALKDVQKKIETIKARYADTPVGLTETIFLYQSGPLGLNVLTPLEFQEAVAEGNDPPADTVAKVNNQVSQGQIKVLIYNEQVTTPLTTRLKTQATAKNIPLVPITETMPRGKTYQTWMLDQLNALEQALQKSTGK